MVSVRPARRRTSPRVVVPVGLGDGVGHCHDVANLPEKCLFDSLVYLFGEKTLLLSKGMVSYFRALLSMLVVTREPTPCYRDAFSVGTLSGHYGRKAGKNSKTTFSSLFGRFFLVSKRTIFFFWGL